MGNKGSRPQAVAVGIDHLSQDFLPFHRSQVLVINLSGRFMPCLYCVCHFTLHNLIQDSAMNVFLAVPTIIGGNK